MMPIGCTPELVCLSLILTSLLYSVAAIARRVYIRPNVGVGALRKVFGGSKRFGGRPAHFALASDKIQRHILQQFTKLGLMEESKNSKGGRVLTSKGRQELDYVSSHFAAKKSAVTH